MSIEWDQWGNYTKALLITNEDAYIYEVLDSFNELLALVLSDEWKVLQIFKEQEEEAFHCKRTLRYF